ncbi:hypothetical protein VTK26DRAFT_6476 [Humicola hyalothermophila]
MFDRLGVGPALSLLGGASTLMCAVPLLFLRYGEALRERSAFAVAISRESLRRGVEEGKGVMETETEAEGEVEVEVRMESGVGREVGAEGDGAVAVMTMSSSCDGEPECCELGSELERGGGGVGMSWGDVEGVLGETAKEEDSFSGLIARAGTASSCYSDEGKGLADEEKGEVGRFMGL